MHAVVRRYSNANGLMDAMAARTGEVTELIGGVPGFVAYYATRSGDELVTVTVCDDETGIQESSRRAADWVAANAADTGVSPVERHEGAVFMSI